MEITGLKFGIGDIVKFKIPQSEDEEKGFGKIICIQIKSDIFYEVRYEDTGTVDYVLFREHELEKIGDLK